MRVLRTCQHPHLINLTPNLSHNFVLVLCRFVLLKKILCCPPYLTKGEWVLALTLSWTFQKISPFPSIRPAVRALRLPGCDGCCIFSITYRKAQSQSWSRSVTIRWRLSAGRRDCCVVVCGVVNRRSESSGPGSRFALRCGRRWFWPVRGVNECAGRRGGVADVTECVEQACLGF